MFWEWILLSLGFLTMYWIYYIDERRERFAFLVAYVVGVGIKPVEATGTVLIIMSIVETAGRWWTDDE